MKLQNEVNNVVRSDDFEQSNYTIEASAKAFSILSDGLYSNKIRAVIRELSTNAYDAHVEAGKPKVPFNVTMPDRFNPHFAIRDFGTGLSHEDCMNLYTTYFGSTKTNTNDAVGCLGLGSKSPFAYTDSFIVTSYHNGKVRVYNSFKDEHNKPVFALMSEDDTTEVNGLHVLFSVDTDDVQEFEEEAKEVYKHFKVKPNFNSDIEIEDFDYVLTGSTWGLLNSNKQRRWDIKAKAIMGQVAYDLDAEQFSDNETVTAVLRTNLHIHFAIGDVDITPSRESLSYNEYTKKAVVEACEFVIEEMKETLGESFDDCPTHWDARIKYNNFRRVGGHLSEIVKTFSDKIQWNGKDLFDDAYDRLYAPKKVVQDVTGADMEVPKYKMRKVYRENWKAAISCDDIDYIRFDSGTKDIVVILDDLKRGAISRAKNYAKGQLGDKHDREKNKFDYYLISDGDKQSVMKWLGCTEEHLILASSLPSVTRSRSNNSGASYRSKVCIWDYYRGQWKDTEVDMEEGGLYFEINRYEIVGRDGNRMGDWNNIRRFNELLTDIGCEIDEEVPIYGIKSQELKKKKFNADGQWTSYFDYMQSAYNDRIAEVLEWNVEHIAWRQHENASKELTANWLSEVDNLPEEIQEYVDDYKWYRSNEKLWVAMSALKRHLGLGRGLQDDVTVDPDEWNKRESKITDTFPVLNYTELHSYYDNEAEREIRKAHILDYINLVLSSK